MRGDGGHFILSRIRHKPYVSLLASRYNKWFVQLRVSVIIDTRSLRQLPMKTVIGLVLVQAIEISKVVDVGGISDNCLNNVVVIGLPYGNRRPPFHLSI